MPPLRHRPRHPSSTLTAAAPTAKRLEAFHRHGGSSRAEPEKIAQMATFKGVTEDVAGRTVGTGP